MQTWWGVFDKSNDDGEPVAMFRRKGLAVSFNTKYKGDMKPMHFYETEDEADFLEDAEEVWIN